MKAAVLTGYNKKGTQLELRDVPVPSLGRGDVRVKVHTAGVNPLDNMIVLGDVKLVVPYRFPLVMGNEFAGVIEEVGAGVEGFKPGDRVYARMPLDSIGAFAEYVVIDAKQIAHVPEYLSDEEAAAVPLTALTAVQAFELMDPKPGENVFISGGTGSLGAMAIPVAKSLGLIVVTNGSAANRDRVLALGADRFIDYKKEDYSKELSNMDYVLDTLGDKELEKEFSILKSGGKLVSLRGLPNCAFAKRAGMPKFKQLLFKVAGGKYDKMAARRNQTYDFIFVHEDGAGLADVSKTLEANGIRPSVDGVYSLEDVNHAMAKVAAGGSKGKTILKID